MDQQTADALLAWQEFALSTRFMQEYLSRVRRDEKETVLREVQSDLLGRGEHIHVGDVGGEVCLNQEPACEPNVVRGYD